ncbi:MAG TPA: SelT/SelW/SelH family protein [Nitrospinota bacterium]|nr:SelT/SelW/SelH family protein [Nitrospinota bacterium]|tara:strand:- start:177800 stop:178042 length:243 start_codon:yes stop_codon:yes gene_type:complete
MLVSITYCRTCNFFPIAAKLGMDLTAELGCEMEYTPGKNGAFEIFRDGDLIFSKNKHARLPNKGEVLGILKGEFPSNPEK